MNKKLKVCYHLDKLVLVYQIPDIFMSDIVNSMFLPDPILSPSSSNVFIFSQKFMSVNYTCPIFIVEYRTANEEHIKIAEFRNDILNAITLTVDNMLFYSDNLNLLYEFESYFNLTLEKIVQLDVACDSNLNLPKKLNDFIHRPECVLKRIGTKLPTTEKGNQIVGTKILPNIKVTSEKERPKASFYYSIRTSGNRRPIIFRGYNKSQEISEKSHKNYIEEADGFGGIIYRFEVSIPGRDLRQRAKKDERMSLEFIYNNLVEETCLKEIFINISTA